MLAKGHGFARRVALAAAVVMVLAAGLSVPVGASSSSSSAATWEPPAPSYDVALDPNVEVAMDDGTVLRVDVHSPADPATGEPAPGPFPVILTQTPYGKDIGSAFPANSMGGVNTYLVQRGYIHVVADIRGTGTSEGVFGLFDPEQAEDGAALVHWAAERPGSNGRVGLLGPSYLGIIQLLTAAAVGPDSPLKAIFPVVAANDFYRDIAFVGGVPNIEFSAWWLGLTALAQLGNPIGFGPRDPAALLAIEQQRLEGLVDFHAGLTAEVVTDGDRAYAEEYWDSRAPAAILDRIVANDIPAFLVGGWHDMLQRGAPMNYAGLQNAWAGRPVHAPMNRDQPVSGRYQLLMGPWWHSDYGEGLDLHPIALERFETWLRDAPTGMADTATPLHVYDLATERWSSTTHYPFLEATPTTYYLNEGGNLSPTAPSADAAADPIVFTGVGSPCNRSSEQWGAGAFDSSLQPMGLRDPCVLDDSTIQVGPGTLTYTTEPFVGATTLAGPIGVSLYATSTRPDALWVATIEDISPSGQSTPITSGALLGRFRALDETKTWSAPDGRPIQPYHPFTRASAQPIPSDEVTRFDIEVFPTLVELAPGHRLRLTLNTTSTPWLLTPTPNQLADLVGGVYLVQRTATAASSVQLPLAPGGAFTAPCRVCQ